MSLRNVSRDEVSRQHDEQNGGLRKMASVELENSTAACEIRFGKMREEARDGLIGKAENLGRGTGAGPWARGRRKGKEFAGIEQQKCEALTGLLIRMDVSIRFCACDQALCLCFWDAGIGQ